MTDMPGGTGPVSAGTPTPTPNGPDSATRPAAVVAADVFVTVAAWLGQLLTAFVTFYFAAASVMLTANCGPQYPCGDDDWIGIGMTISVVTGLLFGIVGIAWAVARLVRGRLACAVTLICLGLQGVTFVVVLDLVSRAGPV